MSILVTGFDPGRDGVNASAALVTSLRDDLPADLLPFRSQLHFAILPLSSRELGGAVLAQVAASRPRFCVFTGQARGRHKVNLERLATNLKDFESPDVEGGQPRGELIEPAGPAACWSTLPGQQQMVDRLNDRGIPAALSNHGGNHLCNQLLYQMLYWARQSGSGVRCGLVHIPPLPVQAQTQWPETPVMPLAMTRAALTCILLVLAAQLAEEITP
ncbi:pyroglutamyl-peptidase I [Porticoccus sp.]